MPERQFPALYNEATYSGRVYKFFDQINPRHLLHSNSTIERCQALLANELEAMSTVPGGTEHTGVSDSVKKCQSIVSACVHPTTGKILPLYGRVSFFVPINIPLCAGMLLTPTTLPNLVIWQWLNQTYNAVFNYCNAAHDKMGDNAVMSPKESYKTLGRGYLGAVMVSVGLAVGLTQGLKRAKIDPRTKQILQVLVPYTAVASAGMANVALMRYNESQVGLPVRTPQGTYIGHSKIAARKAILEAAIARAVLSIPIFLFPPPLIALALRFSLIRSSKILKAACESMFLTSSIALGLPCAFALFPQTSVLALQSLEEPLRNRAEELMKSEYSTTSQESLHNSNVVFTKEFHVTQSAKISLGQPLTPELSIHGAKSINLTADNVTFNAIDTERSTAIPPTTIQPTSSNIGSEEFVQELDDNLKYDNSTNAIISTPVLEKISISTAGPIEQAPTFNYISHQSCFDSFDLLEDIREETLVHVALWRLLIELQRTVGLSRSALSPTLFPVSSVPEAGDNKQKKTIIYALDALQATCLDVLSPRQLIELSKCESVPEKGWNIIQAIVVSGDDKAIQHKFINTLWRSFRDNKQDLATVVDKESNNLVHLAVLSENPAMLQKILNKIDPRDVLTTATCMLQAKNREGQRPLDLVNTITPTIKHGMRAILKKHFWLLSSYLRLRENSLNH